MIVILDTNVIISLVSPNLSDEVTQCKEWLLGLLSRIVNVVSSDICDYEVRRELLRIAKQRNLKTSEKLINLNALKNVIEFLPLTTETMFKASEIWAELRNRSRPTTDNKNIDVDVILSAHWSLLSEEYRGKYVVIATQNIRDFELLTEAKNWRDINF